MTISAKNATGLETLAHDDGHLPSITQSLRISEGTPADFLVLPGKDQYSVENVALNPTPRRIIIKDGKVIARREIESVVL